MLYYMLYYIYTTISNPLFVCSRGAMDERRTRNPKVGGSNLGTDHNFEKVSCDRSEAQ